MKRLLFFFLSISALCFSPAKTFLFIGDSITDGNWGSPSKYPCSSNERNLWDKNHILGHGYVEMTAGYFMGEQPDSSYYFINRGISGETLSKIASRWERDALSHNPDIISLLCGTNDIHYWLETGPNSIEEFDFKAYEATLDSLVSFTIQNFPNMEIVLCTPFVAQAGWAGEEDNFPLRKHAVDKIAEITRNVAGKHSSENVSLVDFNSLLDTLLMENADPSYWIWDGIHPTTAMHYRMSRHWIENFD